MGSSISFNTAMTMQEQRGEVTLEQVEKFYKFLQGELPDGVHVKPRPRLSSRRAFDVIWYLQEVMGLIPEHFERCITCGCLYDSNNEGHYDERNGHHCDSCDSRIFWRDEDAKAERRMQRQERKERERAERG